ncbi:MCM10 Minichromosome maintenance protein 10 [Candida maltosa Xu316]
MDDPRYETVVSDDVLTEDSSDELKDLVKEFELKYEKIKQKKKEKAKLAEKIKQEKAYKHVEHKQDDSNKPSNFLNKLYDASSSSLNSSQQQIDYSKRKFEFELDDVEYKATDAPDELESISKIHLRKRYLSRSQVDNAIKQIDPEMKFLKIEKFLAKTHKSNNYAEPQYSNWCLVCFVLSKSPVQIAANKAKYMKLKVGNFMNAIDLIIFDKACEKYRKLQPGDLLFILNPIINKFEIQIAQDQWKSGFTLKMDTSNMASILEVGSVRDFGVCKFIKRNDNSRCTNIINIKNQELCDVHLDMKFKSSSRMELNGSVTIRSPKKNKKNMYLDNKGTGFIKQYNEDTNLVGMMHPSPFDMKKYQDPKILETQIKRRKLLDDRANEKLEKKLSKLGSKSLLSSLQLAKGKDVSVHTDSKNKGFPSSMISQIGFDPTGLSNDLNKAKKGSRLQELHDLSAKTSAKKTLATSKEDKDMKKTKWRSNISFETKKRDLLKVDNRKRVVMSDDDDDDDDIDIQFDSEEAKKRYAEMTSKVV